MIESLSTVWPHASSRYFMTYLTYTYRHLDPSSPLQKKEPLALASAMRRLIRLGLGLGSSLALRFLLGVGGAAFPGQPWVANIQDEFNLSGYRYASKFQGASHADVFLVCLDKGSNLCYTHGAVQQQVLGSAMACTV